MKEKRMTKRDYFETLKGIVVDNTELVEFIDAQIALLDKKKGSVNSKKVEAVNEMTETVFNALVELNAPSTATEIANAVGVSNQKVSAYLGKLAKAGRVVKSTEKRVSRFSVVAE